MIDISPFFQEQLDYFIKSGSKKDDKLNTPLHCVLLGINCGQIKGPKDELSQFILSFITEISDISQLNQRGLTPINQLFKPAIGRPWNEEIKENIKLAFSLIFEKDKLALVRRGMSESSEYIESAIEKIGAFPTLLKELEPELLRFITEFANQLNEEELRLVVYSLHGNPLLLDHLSKVLSLEDSSASDTLERNSIGPVKLEKEILSFWYPEHRGEVDFFFDEFPLTETWRLFMDGDKQVEESGWETYASREKGCIDKLYQAWKYVIETIQEPLTPHYFKTIHAICAKDIASICGEYREYGSSFGMTNNNLSFLGYFDLIQHFSDLCGLEKTYQNNFYAYSRISSEKLNDKILEFIQEYEEALKNNADDPFLLLTAIINFCKKLELIHPFSDCNGRIFCNVLLNRELIRNGFSPAILDNPNRLEGLTNKEFLYELIRGMNNFKQVTQEAQYKDSPSTSDLVKTYKYPIPELLMLFEKVPEKSSITFSKWMNQFGLMRDCIKETYLADEGLSPPGL